MVLVLKEKEKGSKQATEVADLSLNVNCYF